ncbi:hypothetical protein BGX31_008058 [Mortierella sp. GBA43]|nr:hypothetical protein BGX31_008058 [Mortierella sp. GBA43]
MDLARSLFQPTAKAALTTTPVRQKPSPTTTSNHFLSLLFFHESNSWPSAARIGEEQLKNFQFLKRTFATILAALLRDRNRQQLVILCPVQQSLIGCNELSKLEWEWGGIDEEFIITTAKGFKLLKQARLISEEMFYDNEGMGWIIQFIDRPLVGMSRKEAERDADPIPAPVTDDQHEDERLSPASSPAPQTDSQHASRTSRRGKLRSNHFQTLGAHYRRSRKPKSRPLLTLQIVFQRFPGVSLKLEQLIRDFNDEAMTKSSLDDIRSTVDRLLAASVNVLNRVNSRELAALLDEYGATVDNLDQLLESHLLNSTYDIVFFKITLQLKQHDGDLAEAIHKLRNLDLGQVGLSDTQQDFQCLVSALNEFQSFGILRTPREKFDCLLQTVRHATTLSGGADDLIPILILTVLRSGISNLASNLYYMKNFVFFGDATQGEWGYCFSTLDAVSRYILSHVKQLSPISSRNRVYWEKICSGDLAGIKEIYAKASESIGGQSAAQPPPPPLLRTHSVASVESSSNISFVSSPLNGSSASGLQSRDAEGNNGVLLACKFQQIDVLRYLLETEGLSLDVSNYEGMTPLMMSVDVGNLEMTKMILETLVKKCKTAIDKQDVIGNTAAHFCVSKRNSAILEELLKANPDLGLPSNEGETPLIMAARLNDEDGQRRKVVSMLASKMKVEDLNRQDNSGDTALQFIADPTLITELVDRGANPDVDNYSGWTPLLKWAFHDDVTAVRGLLNTGRVDTLIMDSRGYTPLHMACLKANMELVEILQAHTPIDVQSIIDGCTPLQLACQSGAAAVVEFLLKKGANPQLCDWSDESPADMTNDATILELLDNAMLFWDATNDRSTVWGTDAQPTTSRRDIKRNSGKAALSMAKGRVIRVVRGTMEEDGRVKYIVKSGCSSDPSSIVTMSRTLDEFEFLRENLLVEGPDACIPSLEGFYSPFLLSPSRPSKTVLSISARRLDMFLNYLSNHPVLANHELVWEFMLMPELQQEMIVERSRTKQVNAIDSIFDNFPRRIENLENEEAYFKHFSDEIVKLDEATQLVRKYARRLSRSTQDVPQQLEIFAEVLERTDAIGFSDKCDYTQALRTTASIQMTMHMSDIESIGNLFEDFSFVINGTLKALKHPQEVINSIRQLRVAALKAEQSMRRNDMIWSGLSTIGGGAMTVLGGAGTVLGAAGSATASTLGAVSASFFSGNKGTGRGRHAKAASESIVKKPYDTSDIPPPLPPRPLQASPPPASPSSQGKGSRSSLVIKLSPSTSQTSLESIMGSNAPIQSHPRTRSSLDSVSRPLSTSILTTPFTAIAEAASAATGQVPLEELNDKIGKASSLLNSLRSSLFEELTHLQDHHTRELQKAMRDFGARQLQIERSRLRDMMEILDDLQIGANTATSAAPTNSGLGLGLGSGSQTFGGSTTNDLSTGWKSRGVSRQSSFGAQTPGIGSSHERTGFPFGSGADEKAEAREQQRLFELQRNNSARLNARRTDSLRQGAPSDNRDKDAISEKAPFDDD